MVIKVDNVRFHSTQRGNFLAYASVVVSNMLVIRHMRLTISKKTGRLVLSMPAKQTNSGEWVEICNPISREMRGALEDAVFKAWHEQVALNRR